MNVIIVEDEPRSAENLRSLLKEVDSNIDVKACLGSISELEEWYSEEVDVDLAFCDIELRDGTVFDFFENRSFKTPIIFITNHGHYAIKAFQEYSISFILKPVDPWQLSKAISKFKKLTNKAVGNLSELKSIILSNQDKKNYKKRFLTKIKDQLHFIESDKIALFKSHLGTTHLYTIETKRYFVDGSLNQVEKELDPNLFFRVNRKCIININHVNEVRQQSDGGLEISTCDPMETFKISRTKSAAFRDWMSH
ncbi:MAG: response regulator transcription factor [Cyclobacteriaceae bacterium]